MNFSKGDHLVVKRPLYTHHGLYIGDGKVIHYLLDEGLIIVSLEEFSQGEKIMVKPYAYSYSPNKTIERAKSRLNESDYSLLFNNCEHFVTWCKTGVSESKQVKETSKELYELLGINNDMQSNLLNLSRLFEKQHVHKLKQKRDVPLKTEKPTLTEFPFFTESELEELLELGNEVGKTLEDAMTSVETFFDDMQKQIDSL